MPQEERSLSSFETDIWSIHKSIIRKLYLEDKKTLKGVKEIMELYHGFPSFPLSTYGAKLRDQLNLPKKLKKRDWPVVYRHYQRRQAEGKQTHIYLNDTFIPWNKAWKEMRRNRVLFESRGTITTPLPRGVMLKTPPPSPFPAQVCNSPSRLVTMPLQIQGLHDAPDNAVLAIIPQQSLNSTVPFPDSSGNRSSQSVVFYRKLSLICLENIPWFALRKTLLRRSRLTSAASHHPQSIVHDIEQAMHRASTLPIADSNGLGIQFDPLHTLAKVVYIISNNLMCDMIDHADESAALINLLFTRMPQQLVVDLLDNDLLSARAAWEGIARLIHLSKRKDFISLMKLGLNRPTWILPHGHVYLSVAVLMGCIDIVRSLLRLGVRADERLPKWTFSDFPKFRPAIYEAVASRDVECLELLVENCDVNSTIFTDGRYNISNSSLILISMGHSCQCSGNSFWRLEFHQASLAILLAHGANVDLTCLGHLCLQPSSKYLFQTKTRPYTMASLLEHCYYYNKRMYYQLAPFSLRSAQGLYRDKICLEAAMGVSALLHYLNSTPGVDATFLGLVFAEQFFVGVDSFDSAVVRALLELGVAINTSTPDECFTTLLRRIVRKVRIFGFDENDIFIMRSLLYHGALLNSRVLALAVEDKGTKALELMLALGADFRQEGACALYTATRRNNFVAVSWLLQRDVDINAAIEARYSCTTANPISITVAALTRTNRWVPHEDLDLEAHRFPSTSMLKYLMDHGAKLWVNSLNSGPYITLRVILQNSYSNPQLFDTVSLLLDHGRRLRDLPNLGSYLLEDSLSDYDHWSATHPKSKVFELLWKHGAPVYPGAVLARLIRLGAPRQLVINLMDAGADINAYTTEDDRQYNAIQVASQWWDQSLVSELIERGGNINSPALGFEGMTALQAACYVTATSEMDRRAQIAFIEFLIRNNADVNAPPPIAYQGRTALQSAAIHGNIELLSLFLGHEAQVNAPNHSYRRCALDFASEKGRLDSLYFLLKAGALSYCHGQSGYEGAIQLADDREFFVVADSLRRHVRNNERLFSEQPALAAAHGAAMAERSWTDEHFRI